MTKLQKITNDNVVYTFALDRKTFDKIWYHIFARDNTPYAYDERDRLWDLMTCEHQDEKRKK